MRDKPIQKLITAETRRQGDVVNLIASENYVSGDVLEALGSPLTNKYAEGYPALRYYGGNEYIDQIENLAKEHALETFGLKGELPFDKTQGKSARPIWHVNVQPYSGSPANLAVLLALVPFHEKIMGLQLDMGGHLTHGHKVSITGKAWQSAPYAVDKKTELLDYGAILEQAKKEKPRLIIAGFTAYPRVINFKKFREIADTVGAYLMVDMSHFAGLVAGGVYPSPFPYADVVTTTAHKTLRGPRAAIIFSNRNSKIAKKNGADIAKLTDKAVFPGLQGGPHANQIAAVAVALHEARTPTFKTYAAQVVKNAKALADELSRLGWRIVSGGTDTHLLLVDTWRGGNPSTGSGRPITGRIASDALEKNGIIVNKNTIPYDSRPPMDPSGIRLGTPALTSRGMKEKEMREVARLIHAVLAKNKNAKTEVAKLCKKFPLWYTT